MRPIRSCSTLLFAFTLVGTSLAPNVRGAEPIVGDCYCDLSVGKAIVGNEAIRLRIDTSKGAARTYAIENPTTGAVPTSPSRKSDFSLGDATKTPSAGRVASGTKPATAILPECATLEFVDTYPGVEVKRVVRAYPGCPVIGNDFYVRRTASDLSFSPEETRLASIGLDGRHWKFTAAEFFDRTDGINTLVQEATGLAYGAPMDFRGNVLIANNLTEGKGLVVLKESPCSFVQLHYPRRDFTAGMGGIDVLGAGVAPEDLPEGEWVKTYGVAIGVTDGTRLGALRALRAYHKRLRRREPSRDDMIMMNTWGDRNKDARIGEAFVKEQIDACARLGVTHLQIDDGWQQGLSKNSASSAGRLWDQWDRESWKPHKERFPNGFAPIVEYAKQRGVKLGLWFHPSNANDYERWEQDAEILAGMYHDFGIQYFKIDGVKLPTKRAEVNLRRFLDKVLELTDNGAFFNLDATADNRGGYHDFQQYGNVFLENRYTDFARYYPHWTLRNLWMLSEYVPPERLQIEFLNKWRNANKYDADDPLAPGRAPFDYCFALTMMGQPLAWFEGSNLPEEAFEIAPLVKQYREVASELHNDCILPIGDEPSGRSWTGFQSIQDDEHGFILVFREWNDDASAPVDTHLPPNVNARFEHVLGHGVDFNAQVDERGAVRFVLPERYQFALYRYTVE